MCLDSIQVKTLATGGHQAQDVILFLKLTSIDVLSKLSNSSCALQLLPSKRFGRVVEQVTRCARCTRDQACLA